MNGLVFFFSKNKNRVGAGRMAQWMKVFATKHEPFSSVSVNCGG